jgi:sigma-B regulation protein RsbU (phosphoserine phosphatase)
VEQVLNKALAKKPETRYQQMSAMVQDLKALLENEARAGSEEDDIRRARPERGQPQEVSVPRVREPSGPVKLLVVDDEPDLELLVRQHFRKAIRAGEFEFAFAANGIEALEKLEADETLDIVLTDIRMPGMDGLAFLGRLPDLDRTVKAVVVSAYGDLGNIRTAMNRGAFDFLTKPIDFADLEATIAKTNRELNHYREASEARRRLSAMEQEMDAARRIQAAGAPRALPDPGALDRYVFTSPAREVGGDFHDLFLIGPETVGIVIGKVLGTGVGAAMFAAMNRALLKALALRGESPEAILGSVGRLLRSEGLNATSVTALVGVLDCGSGAFRYASAGHGAPYRLSAVGGAGADLLLGAGGPSLGSEDAVEYTAGQVTLEPGEGLFFYTDGIPEALDENRTLFSHERLRESLSRGAGSSPAEIVRGVIRDLDAFLGDAPQVEDLTAMAVRFRGGP